MKITQIPLVIVFVIWTWQMWSYESKHIKFCEKYGFPYDGGEYMSTTAHLILTVLMIPAFGLFLL